MRPDPRSQISRGLTDEVGEVVAIGEPPVPSAGGPGREVDAAGETRPGRRRRQEVVVADVDQRVAEHVHRGECYAAAAQLTAVTGGRRLGADHEDGGNGGGG